MSSGGRANVRARIALSPREAKRRRVSSAMREPLKQALGTGQGSGCREELEAIVTRVKTTWKRIMAERRKRCRKPPHKRGKARGEGRGEADAAGDGRRARADPRSGNEGREGEAERAGRDGGEKGRTKGRAKAEKTLRGPRKTGRKSKPSAGFWGFSMRF